MGQVPGAAKRWGSTRNVKLRANRVGSVDERVAVPMGQVPAAGKRGDVC